MRINIAYFTSTGNTLFLCTKTQSLMEKAGHEVHLYEIIKDQDAFSKDPCDLLGFFYPVWGSNPPDPMVAYREKMPAGNGKKVFLLGNCCALNGDTGHFFKQVLESKGYDVQYTQHFIMPTNFNLPYEPENKWKRVPLKEERDQIIAAALVGLEKSVEAILAGERKDDGKAFFEKMMGGMQRKTYWMGGAYKSHFSIAEDKCVHCDLCIKMCPTGNITKDEDGKKVFGDKCILCVKCYNLCPKDAVLIGQVSIDDEKYRRYKGPSPEIHPVTYR